MPRFLVDENLSVKLPEVAHKRGFGATHVVHLGLREWKDWSILEIVERDGWVLVTNNAIEFRSRYRAIKTHPGVIFLLPSVRREQQLMLFEAALDDIAILMKCSFASEGFSEGFAFRTLDRTHRVSAFASSMMPRKGARWFNANSWTNSRSFARVKLAFQTTLRRSLKSRVALAL